ncbi:MAG: hypothetical protein ACYS0F_11440 [Planctomycetota bacterium]
MRNEVSETQRRRALLPWWIKVLCWPLLIFLTFPILVPLMALDATGPSTVNVPGLQYTGNAWDPEMMLLDLHLFIHGVAAYGLLRGRSWGPSVGMCVCALGLTILLATLAANARMEPAMFFYTLVLWALWRLRDDWLGLRHSTSPVA